MVHVCIPSSTEHVGLTLPPVCAPGGYLEYQGHDISAAQNLIPKLQRLLQSFRTGGFQVYHTREGTSSDQHFLLLGEFADTCFQATVLICQPSRAENHIGLATMPLV